MYPIVFTIICQSFFGVSSLTIDWAESLARIALELLEHSIDICILTFMLYDVIPRAAVAAAG